MNNNINNPNNNNPNNKPYPKFTPIIIIFLFTALIITLIPTTHSLPSVQLTLLEDFVVVNRTAILKMELVGLIHHFIPPL